MAPAREKLPDKYGYLLDESAPRLLVEAMRLYGVKETQGSGNTSEIMAWAKRTGLDKWYKADSTAWCGLFMAYVALEAGFPPEFVNPLGARNWLQWGSPIERGKEMLGDVLVKARPKGGHVAIIVGEDRTHFHCLGGNQADTVNIRRIPKIYSGPNAILGIRRCKWLVAQPPNVRKIWLDASGPVAGRED